MNEKHVPDPFMPDDMLMQLYSPNAPAINDDPEWRRVRILLGALFRKHGPFSIEILKKGIWVGTTRVDGHL